VEDHRLHDSLLSSLDTDLCLCLTLAILSNAVASLDTARSFLFAPGNDPRKLERAVASGADAVIADLEDAVPVDEKAAARALTARVLGGTGAATLRLARVNGVGTPWVADDVGALVDAGLDGVVLPKATAAAVRAVETLGVPVLAIVETPAGLRCAYELGTTRPVAALMLGAVDLGLALGLEQRSDGLELLHARSSLVVDSAAAGLRGPVDRVWTALGDDAGLAADCALARSLGFRGKACIHPDHVEIVNGAFSPTEAELERAQAVVAAYESATADGRGAVALDGEMIDLPVVDRARRLLAETNRSVAHGE
jgi:citrate lyase subunit beta/citryl-CoA lyase